MPMPEGLIPVGNAVSATGNAGSKGQSGFAMPASRPPPSSNMLRGMGGGAPSGLSALRQQYEPLPWNNFYDSTEMINETIPIYIAGAQGHIFLCMHGAGHTAMSFAVFAE